MKQAIKSSELQVQIREATEADVPFIFNSWLKSYRGSYICKGVSNPVYFEFQHKTIEALLQRCQVQVLCSSTDSNELYGYLVHEVVQEVPVLHYAYIKHTYRKLGLLKKLLKTVEAPNGGFYTHDSEAAAKLVNAKKINFVYNPYLAFGVL